MSRIERLPARAPGRSGGSAYKDLVFAVATADDRSVGLKGQAAQALAKIGELLMAQGSDRARILTASVYLADISQKADFEAAWSEWVTADPAEWPMRSCVQAGLPPGILVEVVAAGVRSAPVE
ncbi:Rid family hydrolase [Ramlibacter tataouinensis]|uniref:Rid family hydrolase n=1 Tax=Ramlibacter tataouinensis TaxID=94132 RepID=UPI0022F3FC59|nr:Rid family hydrolase [Ramlibacter tataouinensis]WBY00564.1 Rid family hydrolase [Ramlibacter tataouinensis]